jgi:hypothetical protein
LSQKKKNPAALQHTKKLREKPTPQHTPEDKKFSLETFLFGLRYYFLGTALLLSLLFGWLIFDYKISMNGDDSAYIQRAWDFIHKGIFPSFQGPLYPIFLTIPLSIWGLNITILKWTSLICLTTSIFVLFKALEKHLPIVILLPVLLMTAININLLYYGSQTFSEAFFMLMQALLLWVFTSTVLENGQLKDRISPLGPIALGFMVVLLGLTRFVGLAAIVAILVFFLVYKKWKEAALSAGSFAAGYALYNVIKKYVFNDTGGGMDNQLKILSQVDPYDPSQGMETISGYVGRLFDNVDIYLSKLFMAAMALRAEDAEPSRAMGLFLVAALVAATVLAYQYNKALFFSLLYTGACCGLTFVMLQKVWGQERLIIIFIPFLIAGLLGLIYYIGEWRSIGAMKWLSLGVSILLILPLLGKAAAKIQDYSLTRTMNQRGDLLYGLNPDMRNYIEMSRWCKDNLPKGTLVAVRKPTISFVYANGHDFYGIFSTPTENADSLLALLKDNKVTHIMDASIRVNPEVNNGVTISTVRRYMYYIETAYPGTFRLIHEIGTDEKARLYEIRYPDGE